MKLYDKLYVFIKIHVSRRVIPFYISGNIVDDFDGALSVFNRFCNYLNDEVEKHHEFVMLDVLKINKENISNEDLISCSKVEYKIFSISMIKESIIELVIIEYNNKEETK